LGTIQEIFIANLKRLRGKRTQADIAEAAGIPLRSYQNAEINGAIPQGPNLAAIASVYGIPETHLFVNPAEFVRADESLNTLRLSLIGRLATLNDRQTLEIIRDVLDGADTPLDLGGKDELKEPSQRRK